jgi:maleamate amidohydrolase
MRAENLSENYGNVYSGGLTPGAVPALLLVDMVEAYLRPSSPLFCDTARAALDVASELLIQARAAARPVIFTNVEYEVGGVDGGLFYKKVSALSLFERGSEMGRFPDELQPLPGELVVTKQYPSAFFDTGLTKKLQGHDVDTLLIAGYSTSGCIRASALDALQYGFVPFVVKDGCADRHPDPHNANLFDLQAKYAEVIDMAQAVEILAKA